MAAQYKTRCPHCGAQFRISEEHLRQAKGKVRCGSCLEIFQATQHLIDEQGNPLKPRAKQQGQQPARQGSGQQQQTRPSGGGQNRSRQGQGAAQSGRPAGGSGQGRQQSSPASGGQQKQQRPSGQKQAGSGQQRQKGPEDWSLPGQEREASPEQNDSDDSKKKDKDYIPSNDTAVSLGSSELSETFLSMDEEGGDTDHDFSEVGGGGDTDESWAEQLLEELEDDSGGKGKSAEPAEPPSPDSMSLLDEWSEEEEEPPETASNRGAAPGFVEEADETDEDEDEFDLFTQAQGGGDELDFVEIEPPEEKPARKVSLPARPSVGLQWIKWAALSIAALAVFAGQHLAFHFDELARRPEWRPLYAEVCGLIGCTLPKRSSIAKLRGANLVVRSHPQVADALVVDAIIFNEAAYPQPFPQLELTFSSLEENPVASRRFQPAEYRAGELKDLAFMPPGVPIHVSFEILDPGPKAVNYSLRFHPPAEAPES